VVATAEVADGEAGLLPAGQADAPAVLTIGVAEVGPSHDEDSSAGCRIVFHRSTDVLRRTDTAHVITATFADHLPLQRLEGIHGRHGVELTRSTMCDWPAGCAAVLRPVYDAMCDQVRRSKVVHTDDTPVPVQDRTRDRTRTGRLWVYVGDAGHPYTVYDATPSRSRDEPQTFLRGFTGYVQADAFGGCDGLYAAGAVEVACWAHARRKWYDARDSDPRTAHEALARIRAVYDVEDRAKALTAADRGELRRRESVPLLASFADWLEAIRP
jgi:hypothetical protein